MKKKRKKSHTGQVIKDSQKFNEFDANDPLVFKNVPRTANKGSGIYALYNEYGLYYVGLSNRSIRSRLREHAYSDRHKGKWNLFSWYHIPNIKYVKDIESALLDIINPPGNIQTGKIKKKRKTRKKTSNRNQRRT